MSATSAAPRGRQRNGEAWPAKYTSGTSTSIDSTEPEAMMPA
jgi:hypothetical protein